MASSPVAHRELANALRALAMDAVEAAKSGHPGMPMGMADVATVLFRDALKFDAGEPHWADRDRFVLSAGHGSMLLYALLHLTGHASISLDDIRRFRQLGSPCAGHPEFGHAAGIETTTGPLGQGIANAVGMAMAEAHLRARFGAELVDHRTFVIASDGDLMEGISHEAISLAGHLKLGRLIVLFDDNGITIDGKLALSESGDMLQRFEAAGWRAERIDGHDPEAIAAALTRARNSDRPSLIACRTVIGFGAPTRAGSEKSHGSPLGPDEVRGAREALGWPHAPFEIPQAIAAEWARIGARGAAARKSWAGRLAAAAPETRAAFERAMRGDLPAGLAPAMAAYRGKLVSEAPSVATRKASEMALEVINEIVAETIGGSADLTGSNNTKTRGLKPMTAGDMAGRYVFWGVREHAMAAAMNGMALHGGVIPYGGTFLVFSDYCRPSIRLAALMGLRVVFVMTHDSIGLGEDGPTHQPVEHLAALRAIPNLHVFRPADAVETAEAWELALARRDGPSLIALTRQTLPTLRRKADANLSARGAYELAEAGGPAKVSLLATGSEVEIALDARARLEAAGTPARVVSMPSWELFAQQDEAYREATLGPGTVRIAIEAASGFGWERWTGARGRFIGMTGFGASAPHTDLYTHFGITADAAIAAAQDALAAAAR